VGCYSDDESTVVRDPSPLGPSRPDSRKPYLEQVSGSDPPIKHWLALAEMTLGRAANSHIHIDSQSLSRQHLRLVQNDGEVTCTDLDSANGLLLNGIRAHSATLRDGDILQLGDVVLIFREGVP